MLLGGRWCLLMHICNVSSVTVHEWRAWTTVILLERTARTVTLYRSLNFCSYVTVSCRSHDCREEKDDIQQAVDIVLACKHSEEVFHSSISSLVINFSGISDD